MLGLMRLVKPVIKTYDSQLGVRSSSDQSVRSTLNVRSAGTMVDVNIGVRAISLILPTKI